MYNSFLTELLFFLVLLFTSISSFSTASQPARNKDSVPITSKDKLKWEPKIKSLEDRSELRGKANSSERINSIAYHHIEFYCGDAKSTALRFSLSLGMKMTGITGQMTGNDQCISYGLESGDVRFLFTAPYSISVSRNEGNPKTPDVEFDSPNPLPSFTMETAHDFFRNHGLGVKAVGVEVASASDAFDASVANGAKPVQRPAFVPACSGYLRQLGIEDDDSKSYGCEIAEVELYGDVVLRYISFTPTLRKVPSSLPFLPHLSPHSSKRKTTYGIRRLDHAVGNVPDLLETQSYVSKFTGFHAFAEFTAEDVGTVESGLNSVVLASDSEFVLLPINEPTEGRRKSQIQTFLEQNEGPGLQHLALKTDDIFETISKMRDAEEFGGFEFMRRPSDEYFRDLPQHLGDQLTPGQYAQCEELGILADADEEGVLLQIFTKPIGDRPTFFIEIIQRIGCRYVSPENDDLQRPGCGGFGRGNFKELFKAIEVSETIVTHFNSAHSSRI